MQEFLTGLFELIFVSFTLIMVFDFTAGLNQLLPPVRPQNSQDAASNTEVIAASAPISQDEKAIIQEGCFEALLLTAKLPKRPALLPDPWMLQIDEQVTPPSESPQQTVKFKPLLLLPAARLRLDVSALKKYVLHGKPVVRVEDIDIPLPDGLKHYKLRGQSVLHLADLEAALA